MLKDFEGRAVVVTGAGSGIGRAGALLFAERGASVIVSDLNEANAVSTAEEIQRAGGAAVGMAADVSSEDAVATMVEMALSKFGRLDAAFNNAGHPGSCNNVVSCTDQEWDQVMACNVRGIWYCMKHEIPAMLRTGGGSIVNVSSGAGIFGIPVMAAYVASKHAVVGLTKSAALDFGGQNIRVNAICPGMTATPQLDHVLDVQGVAGGDAYLEGVPMGRFGKADEQAAAAVWLCSDGASYVNGVAFPVDGGLAIR